MLLKPAPSVPNSSVVAHSTRALRSPAPLDRLLEQSHRLEDEAVSSMDQGGGADHRHAQHCDLKQVHDRRPARQMGLDGRHEHVDVGGEIRGVPAQRPRGLRSGRVGQRRAEPGPLVLDLREVQAHLVVPWHEQGPLGITEPQHLNGPIEFGELSRQRLRVAGPGRQRHAVGLHAHASRLVDRCCAPLDLPRHP